MVDLQVSPFRRFQVHFAVRLGCVLGCLLCAWKVSFRYIFGAIWVRAVPPITPWATARSKLTSPNSFSQHWSF
jgi:hypothetical protein